MTPVPLSHIVAYFHPNGESSLSTWRGETIDRLAIIEGSDDDPIALSTLKFNPEPPKHFMPPDIEKWKKMQLEVQHATIQLYAFDDGLTFEQKLEIAKTNKGYVVTVMK